MLFVKYNDGYPAQKVFVICVSASLSGLFALRYDQDSEKCLTTAKSETPTSQGYDVGREWRTIFEAIFYTNIATLILISLSYQVNGAAFRRALF
jgi:hypothetical protein